MLNAFASPRRPHPDAREDGNDRKLANPELLGQAFVELISRCPAGNLPQSGGINATVMVTMSIDTLLGGLESADLLTGHQLSPAEARASPAKPALCLSCSAATANPSTTDAPSASTPPASDD